MKHMYFGFQISWNYLETRNSKLISIHLNKVSMSCFKILNVENEVKIITILTYRSEKSLIFSHFKVLKL